MGEVEPQNNLNRVFPQTVLTTVFDNFFDRSVKKNEKLSVNLTTLSLKPVKAFDFSIDIHKEMIFKSNQPIKKLSFYHSISCA